MQQRSEIITWGYLYRLTDSVASSADPVSDHSEVNLLHLAQQCVCLAVCSAEKISTLCILCVFAVLLWSQVYRSARYESCSGFYTQLARGFRSTT